MAIFHMQVKICSKAKGNSVVALAAYNARERIEEEKTGLLYNYSKKDDLVHSAIILPENAPARFADRSTLWNELNNKESRKDSQLSRYFIVALPNSLNDEQNINLVENWINQQLTKRGVIADYAIHNDKNNKHVHINTTMRELKNDGFGNKNRELNNKNLVEIWRRSWSLTANKHLKMNGKKESISHLSFIKQKELAIERAKKFIENNEIEKAEKAVNFAKYIHNKKPKKRKSRQKYLREKESNKSFKLKNELPMINKSSSKNTKEKPSIFSSLKNNFENVYNKIYNKINKKKIDKEKRDALNKRREEIEDRQQKERMIIQRQRKEEEERIKIEKDNQEKLIKEQELKQKNEFNNQNQPQKRSKKYGIK